MDAVATDQPARRRRQVWRDEGKALWVSENPADRSVCAAIFNLDDEERELFVRLEELGISREKVSAEELWTGELVSGTDSVLRGSVAVHGYKLFQIFR